MSNFKRYRGETLTLAATANISFTQIRAVPPWANELAVHAPSATLENILLTFGSKIIKVYHYDDSLAGNEKYRDLTAELTDKNASTVGSIGSLATADFLYVGFVRRARGLAVDVGTVNNVATTIAAAISTGKTGWITQAVTDGTDTGASLAQDALITWTVQAGWAMAELDLGNGKQSPPAYWIRFSWDDVLKSDTTLVALMALGNTIVDSTTGTAEGIAPLLLRSNNDAAPSWKDEIPSWAGAVELTSTSITSAANLNWYERNGYTF